MNSRGVRAALLLHNQRGLACERCVQGNAFHLSNSLLDDGRFTGPCGAYDLENLFLTGSVPSMNGVTAAFLFFGQFERGSTRGCRRRCTGSFVLFVRVVLPLFFDGDSRSLI